MKKKLLSAVLAAAMVISMAACGKTAAPAETTPAATTPAATTEAAPAATTEATPEVVDNGDYLISNIAIEMPLTTSGEKLDILFRNTASGYDDITKVAMWDEYKALTGVDVNWTIIGKSDDRKARIQQALIGGEDFDLILKGKISQSTLVEYGDQGFLLDFADYKEYMPNFWNYMDQHPDTLACIMSPEGNVWSIPQVNSGAELRVSRKIFINKTWLDNLGLDIPTTTDEIIAVLRAFKEQDANGNGDPTDEIPLSTGDWASLQDIFFGAFGLGSRGVHNYNVDWDEKNNTIRLVGTAPEYKQFLEFLNQLYTEGLMDQEQFSMGDTWSVKQADNRIGMFGNTNLAGITSDNGCEWVGIETAITGPNGDQLWSAVRANFHSEGNAMLPATCKNIELACKWLDYFWTDEGSRLYHYGEVGKDCVANDDGSYSYADSVLAPMATGSSFDNCVGAVSPYPGGANPTVEIYPYFGGGETAVIPARTARALFEYKANEFWPQFTFTVEENEELSSIQNDITKTVKNASTEFIMGTRSLDEWDAYVTSIDGMGKDKMLEIYQAAVDRYHALMK